MGHSLTAGCVRGDSLRFLVIGDMGGLPVWPYSTFIEVGTADEMAKIAKQYSPQFILELGDNFYFDGVKNVEDKRFEVITLPLCLCLHVPISVFISLLSLSLPPSLPLLHLSCKQILQSCRCTCSCRGANVGGLKRPREGNEADVSKQFPGLEEHRHRRNTHKSLKT